MDEGTKKFKRKIKERKINPVAFPDKVGRAKSITEIFSLNT